LGEVCFLNGVINVQTAKASQKRHHGQEALEEIIIVPSDFRNPEHARNTGNAGERMSGNSIHW